MKFFYNPGAMAKIFSALSKGKVTEEEFMASTSIEETEALYKKAGLFPDTVSRVEQMYSRVEGSLSDGFIEMVQDDTIGPAPQI